MQPRFDSLNERTGIAVVDPVGGERFVLYTPEAVTVDSTDTGAFIYPVSVARRFVTSEIVLPYTVPVAVRDASEGNHLREVHPESEHRFDADEYVIEIDAPVKLYLRVDSSLAVRATKSDVRFEFDRDARVELGARSYHEAPATTVTVPDDPAAAMEAVSTFGSALKTTSPERSWPTLRGHPPRVELGDELSIPSDLDVPDTGVTLHVPADYEHVLPVAPLAYYLGATVVPGDPPRLTTDQGFEYRLGETHDFEEDVARTLKRVLLLDAATRTEGLYPMDLAERRTVESVTSLDFESLYEAPLTERLREYLSVPGQAVNDALSTWSRVTHVRPIADSLEVIPYVTMGLSIVRTKTASPGMSSPPNRRGSPERDALSSFKREPSLEGSDLDAVERPTGVPDADDYVPLPETEAMERAWAGDGTPVHGTKLHPAAFRHERTESTDGIIRVTVVCNDEEMREEWDTVSEVYGKRDVVPFDVDCRFGVSTDELRALLTEDHDLFHFIGHVDGRGLQCPDGLLDAETLPEIGATTVLLNACRSYNQGVEFLKAGARAAIVSWGDVGNLGAVEVGETFARLLNYGYTVGAALEIVEEYTAIGRHYVAVGDPDTSVAQCRDGVMLLPKLGADIEKTQPRDKFEGEGIVFASGNWQLGGTVEIYLQCDDDSTPRLVPSYSTFTTTYDELESWFDEEVAPIVVDGELRWTNEVFGDD